MAENNLNLSKKYYIYIPIILGVIILLVSLVLVFLVLFKEEPKASEELVEEKTLQEILKSISSPPGKKVEIPEEVLESISAPPEESPSEASQEIIDSLTAPE